MTPDSEAPQVFRKSIPQAGLEYAGLQPEDFRPSEYYRGQAATTDSPRDPRILGLRRSTFWIIVVCFIGLIAIGGISWGIDGTIKSNNLKQAIAEKFVTPIYSLFDCALSREIS
jgi:hypothetical protein